MRGGRWPIALLVAGGLARGVPAATATPPAPDQDALARHLLARLTWGPRPGDLDRVRAMGASAFVEEQLHPEAIDDVDLDRRLERFDVLRSTPGQLYKRYPQPKESKRAGKTPAEETQPRRILEQLAAAKLIRAVYGRRQLEDVMTDFWFNHFNVFWGKDACKWLTPSFERDAIRPHALGRFCDLLGAVARHPAMLFYLDNRLSAYAKPPPPDAMTAPGRKRGRGLNENYARELLELHTLGVDGGYTQADVIEVARCFTGWTVDRKKGEPRFLFRPNWHDPGRKTVLGATLPRGRTTADAEEVLDLLARHPATARFIATKLCRRFITDGPPAAAVDRVAAAFIASGGDIRATLRTLFASPEFAAPEAMRAKTKTPFEFLASALRALDAETDVPRPMLEGLRAMGQLPYTCEPPTGFPDSGPAWVNAGALLARMRAAHGLASGAAPRTHVDLERVAGCPLDPGPDRAARTIWDRLVGAPMSDATREVLLASAGDPEVTRSVLDDAGGRPDYPKLAALILGSPEFQKR